jgi:hypothetical protein
MAGLGKIRWDLIRDYKAVAAQRTVPESGSELLLPVEIGCMAGMEFECLLHTSTDVDLELLYTFSEVLRLINEIFCRTIRPYIALFQASQIQDQRLWVAKRLL